MGRLAKLNAILQRSGVVLELRQTEDTYLQRLRRVALGAEVVDALVDVGANNGMWSRDARIRGFRGPIVSVEPQSREVAKIKKLVGDDPKWWVFHGGAGRSESNLELHVSDDSVSSSLLANTSEAVSYMSPGVASHASETVRVAPLDQIVAETCGPFEKGWLKIDAQGYEGEVLAGAERTLSRCVAVEIELLGFPMYESQSSMGYLTAELSAAGFHLFTIDHIAYNRKFGTFLACDALFVRPDFRLPSVNPFSR